MKCSVFNTEDEAKAENTRLMGLLGIPDEKGTETYAIPENRDGKWILKLAEQGTWKADHIALNVEEIDDSVSDPIV